MGRIASSLYRTAINVGVERRVEKLLAKKPSYVDAAPRYAGEKYIIEQLRREHPEWKESLEQKSQQLVDHMNQMNVHKTLVTKTKRRAVETKAPEGQMTLDKIFQLIHDGAKASDEQLANNYGVDKRTAHLLLKYYGIFEIGSDEEPLPPIKRQDLNRIQYHSDVDLDELECKVIKSKNVVEKQRYHALDKSKIFPRQK